MENDQKELKDKVRKELGMKILTYSLNLFQKYKMLGYPEEITTIWFGVSQSLIEMLLTNIHDININKFHTVKANILSQLEKLEKTIGHIDSPTKDMYG